MKTISVKQMQELDRLSIEEAGIKGQILMERSGIGAGVKILKFIKRYNSKHIKRFILLAGKGNNGGDAYVIADFLSKNTDKEIIIYSICNLSELKGDAKYHSQIIPESVKVRVKEYLSDNVFTKGDILIDALLGTGFNGRLREPYNNWINIINKSGCPVISIDIPSGLNGNTGEVLDEAVIADYTITMCLPKYGLLINNGPHHCGLIDAVEIGTPQYYIDRTNSSLSFFTESDAYKLIDRLPANCHKKTFGSVLVIGGSKLYPGAPFLAGTAALKSGAGLVTIAIPQSIDTVSNYEHSLILRKIYDDGKGVFSASSIDELKELINQHDTIILGPGISTNKECADVIKEVLNIDKKIIIDADALNFISKNLNIISKNDKYIYTPHPGEAKRIIDGLNIDKKSILCRINQCEQLSKKLNGTVILKGNKTVISKDNNITSINGSGCQALATAGSGDVLTGILAANYAMISNSFEASCLSVFIHGKAGEIGQIKNGSRGLTSDNLINYIPEALKEISPFA
ncbi:MAG TPA: NAD(P)H-hydrate dehydratase [Victivallales bacterium]|nr:NAD(P)H-hydrate dehydratase [Victivallales bacterium]